jgi:hypothetical protein
MCVSVWSHIYSLKFVDGIWSRRFELREHTVERKFIIPLCCRNLILKIKHYVNILVLRKRIITDSQKLCFSTYSSTIKGYRIRTEKENSKGGYGVGTGWNQTSEEQSKERKLTCDPQHLCSNDDFFLVGRKEHSATGVCDTEGSCQALQAIVACNRTGAAACCESTLLLSIWFHI